MSIGKKAIEPIGPQVLGWYARHKRDLPWRKTRDPYHIWISEVMLQQTRVDTVVPYYHRFLSSFGNVQALASASVDEVLKAWENMGYYARARNLRAAAKQIVERFGGEIPSTWDQLIDLPGIGAYTAGAILSMAFGQSVPAVDGNVKRVLSRVFAIKQPLSQSTTQKRIMDLARRIVPKKDTGSFNQAMMDIGSEICTPKEPSCKVCPIRTSCQACKNGLQDKLPVTRKRPPLPHKHLTAALLKDKRGRLLIVQRPGHGLLGGLWKFPGGQQDSDEPLGSCVQKRVRKELGIRIKVGKSIGSIKHAYTHFRITLHAFNCIHQSGNPKALGCADWRWVRPGQLGTFAFSKADREIMKAALESKG
jgi:A/G-specific adenine glycosylase